MSISFGRLGDVCLKLGRTDEALKYFNLKFEISKVLAEADPNDSQKQRDLLVSHYKLGQVYRSVKDSAKSLAAFDAALEIARSLKQKGLLAEEIDGLINALEAERKQSEQLRDAPRMEAVG